MVDLNCKNTSCLAKIEFDDPSELVMIAVGEIWINSSVALVKLISIFYCQKWSVTCVSSPREGTLRIVGDIRLNINELSNMMGWVIYISKTVVSNEKLLFSTSSGSFKS